jgi:hypothetical protein
MHGVLCIYLYIWVVYDVLKQKQNKIQETGLKQNEFIPGFPYFYITLLIIGRLFATGKANGHKVQNLAGRTLYPSYVFGTKRRMLRTRQPSVAIVARSLRGGKPPSIGSFIRV